MDIDPITIVRTVMAINYKRIQERYPNPNRRDTLTQTGEIPLTQISFSGGVLPTTKVPDTATIFTMDELHKGSSLTPDTGIVAPFVLLSSSNCSYSN